LLRKDDYILADKFKKRKRIDQMIQTRTYRVNLAGAKLWNLHTAAATHPEVASTNKIEFAIDRISISENKIGSRAVQQLVWRQFRPVIHWCAAWSYQLQTFKAVFPQSVDDQYVGDVVIVDFLSLGDIFLDFVKRTIRLPAGQPEYWTTPRLPAMTPRQPGWPDAHVLRPGIMLRPEFLQTASEYVLEAKQLARKWLVSGPGLRAEIIRRRNQKR
jgi:hypothetical protein